MLSATARTITNYESEVQDVPEARWRLFTMTMVHEVARGSLSMVCVLSADNQILDAVSEDMFIGWYPADSGIGVITSRHIRRDGFVDTHSQRFSMSTNPHVLDTASSWQKSQLERSGLSADRGMLTMYRWMTQRTLKAEAQHPELREMKDRITEASRRVDSVFDAPDNVRFEAQRALDRAIGDLIRRVDESSHPFN